MNCPYCARAEGFIFYDTEMPNILSACPEEMLDRVASFPLQIKLCTNCLFGYNVSQLTEEQLSFIYDNYLYISPQEGIGTSKYDGMLATIKEHTNPGDRIVEIGCADGYLLTKLQEGGYTNLSGIDPSPPQDSTVNIVKGYFGADTCIDADHFILMHVLEHFPDPFSIIEHVAELTTGKIFIEVPNFCGYHHQHLSYFNSAFLRRMCEDKFLNIISLTQDNEMIRLVLERDDGIISDAINVSANMARTKASIEQFIAGADKVYWWGAGSTAVVYINSFVTDKEIIVIDGDKNKWGCFVPGVNLEVHPASIISGKEIETLVIASSFHKEIEARMAEENTRAKNILRLGGER